MILRLGRRFWIRRRSAFLALIGVVWVLIGYSYLAVPSSEIRAVRASLRYAVDVAPLWVLAVLWLGAGVAALVDGIVHARGFADHGFTAAVLPASLWCVVYLAQWAGGISPRGWVNAAVFGALAGAIAIVAGIPPTPLPRPR